MIFSPASMTSIVHDEFHSYPLAEYLSITQTPAETYTLRILKMADHDRRIGLTCSYVGIFIFIIFTAMLSR